MLIARGDGCTYSSFSVLSPSRVCSRELHTAHRKGQRLCITIVEVLLVHNSITSRVQRSATEHRRALYKSVNDP